MYVCVCVYLNYEYHDSVNIIIQYVYIIFDYI